MFKRLGCFLAAVLSAGAFAAQAKDEKIVNFDFDHVSCKGVENEIRVVITDLKRSEGLVVVDLYNNDREGFLHRKGRASQIRVAAKAPQTKLCMAAPAAGSYAIAAYHDRNANRTFDKTGLGLPAEPWGLSNNPKVRFGPPPIEKTLFEVTRDGAEVEIKLN